VPSIELNGTSIAYEEAGSGPALLLLHAGIADRRMWSRAIPGFSRDLRVIAPDHRGFGDSPIGPDAFSWTADLLGLMDALDIDRARVVGVSMSAHVALDLAIAHPDRVDRLVLVASGLEGWDMAPEMAAADDAEIEAFEAGDLETAAWDQVRFWLDGPERGEDEVDPALRQLVYEMQLHAYQIDDPSADLSWLVPEYRPRLGEIEVPTLVLAGSLDRVDMRRIAPVLAAEIPGARHQELPGVAHLPPLEDPEGFLAVVRPFLLEA
jgi:pimeloyl-ACP methyl ester carboxylesterase